MTWRDRLRRRKEPLPEPVAVTQMLEMSPTDFFKALGITAKEEPPGAGR